MHPELLDMSAQTICTYAVVGAVTGLVRDLVWHRGLTLPERITMADGAKLLRLGFIGSMVIGAVVAVAVDGSIYTAVGWALAGPEAIERIANARAAGRRDRGQ